MCEWQIARYFYCACVATVLAHRQSLMKKNFEYTQNFDKQTFDELIIGFIKGKLIEKC